MTQRAMVLCLVGLGLSAAPIVGRQGLARDAGPHPSSSWTGPGQPAGTPAATSGRAASEGFVRFMVDGHERQFGTVPDSHNTYTPIGSTIRAWPAAGAKEQFAITVMAIDLKKLAYPLELPLVRRAGQRLDPMAAMANVGFSYTDDAGQEWAGPGRVRIARFGRDGVVQGSFTGVVLPHTGKTLPPVTLNNGRYEARISRPW